jgi:mannose-1-phosphate guanylyltransferase
LNDTPPQGDQMSDFCNWAAILAGGDGRRLQPFTKLIAGDDRPKQFCRLLGRRTLLGDTRARVCLNVEPAHTLYVVTRAHEAFYRRELSDVRSEQLIEQPSNRGTTAAIGSAIVRLRRLGVRGAVGFFPADHYYADPAALHRTIEAAHEMAHQHPQKVVLVGAEADEPETEYGWIEPGPIVDAAPHARLIVRTVARFIEKPPEHVARELLARRCLWNTFISVGRVEAFEDLLRRAVPVLWSQLQVLLQAETIDDERELSEAVYAQIATSDFSRQVLTACPDRLAVINLPGSGWTDLGHASRVLDVLARRERPASTVELAAS